MAVNLGIFDCGRNATLGRTETAPGALFVRLISPTDFDWSLENMRVRIKGTVGIWRGFDLLGMFAGQLKNFLIAYIESAGAMEKAYVPADKDFWINYLETTYPGKFETDNLSVYFDTLFKLQKEGQVTQSVYKPFNYVPTKPSAADIAAATGKGLGINADKLLIYGVLAIGLYAFASGGYVKLLKRRK